MPFDAAPRPPASTTGSISSARRVSALTLRAKSRKLHRDLAPSVSACGVRIPGGGLARLTVGERGARVVGATRCASPWACPVCAPRIAALRAEALRPQVAAHMAAGGSAWLVTLTARHARGDELRGLWNRLSGAWKRVTSGRAWAELRAVGAPQFVRGADLTYGEGAGWHPHLHVLLLLPAAHGDGEVVAAWLLERWRAALEAEGLEALPQGLDARRADSPEAAAAYAVKPAAVYEAGALALKRSKGEGSGRTPFELLQAAVAGDRRAVALWREYVAATKGVRQTTTSRGLKLSEAEELVDADEAAGEGEVVALLSGGALALLDGAPLAELLDAAERSHGDALEMLARELGPPGRLWFFPREKMVA